LFRSLFSNALHAESAAKPLRAGFRWLTTQFSRALYKPKEKDLLTGRRLQQLFGGIPEPSRLPGDTATQDAVDLPKVVQVVCRF
jgi:hypothetical protein